MREKLMNDVRIDYTDKRNITNCNDAGRFRIPAMVRGHRGFIEYRGMPWMRNILMAR